MFSDKEIVFYVNPAWRREELLHSSLMYPFWGDPPARDNVLLRGSLFKQRGFDTTQYRITSKKGEADMVLMPYSHSTVRRAYPELLGLCSHAAEEIGKPLLVDGLEDVQHPIGTSNTFVIRYGGYHFERTAQEIVMPPLANDLLEMYCGGELQIRAKGDIPSISFTGWGRLTVYRTARTVLKELPNRLRGIIDDRFRAKKKGVFFRAQAMRILRKSPRVACNFIVRNSYSGHAHTASRSIEELQKEFVDNVLNSDYGLDVRGDANASTRLFEILSLGRIPVIVDTERNFPFSDSVDYSSFALTVDFRDLKRLPERIAEFHKNISPERFEQMQKNARSAYVSYFRVDALMRLIVGELRAKIAGSR